MNEFVALPFLGCLVAAYLATGPHHRLRPEAAARIATLALVTLLVAAIPTVWLIGISGLRHLGVKNPFTDWSEHLSLGPAGAIFGAAALTLALVGAVRVVAVLRVNRRLRSTAGAGLEVVPTEAVFAYTLPGPAGNIVLSAGLVSALTADERGAVIAHERVHGRHRHDRYLLVARLASALLPFTRSIADRLEFSLERWADHEAAVEVGDRRLVATAIARVAVAGAHPDRSVLGIGRLGAAARTRSLLSSPGDETPARGALAITRVALVAAIVLAVFQLASTAAFGMSLLG